MTSNLRTIMASAAISTLLVASAAIPEGYYNGLEGKTREQLKEAVKQAAREHTAIAYGDDTWEAFSVTDVRLLDGEKIWWDMYSNNVVYVERGHSGMNIEHSIANSWWGGIKNDAYKDIHHLNPADATANNRKSNFPLGIVDRVSWENGVTFVGKPKAGTCGGATNVYEPIDCYKGDFARAFFYLFTIYDDISWAMEQTDRNFMFDGSSYPALRPWAYEMLLEWSRLDPVDRKETERNEAIYGIQHNRNPFIDFPELAEYIWGNRTNTPILASEESPADPDYGIYPEPETGTPDPVEPGDTDLNGLWEYVADASMLAEERDYILVTPNRLYAMSSSVSGKYVAATAGMISISDENTISSIPSDIAVLRLEDQGDGWAIHVYDTAGVSKGYLNATTAKSMNFASSTGAGTTVTITPTEEKTLIEFGETVGTLQYNASNPRFVPYTSNQQPVCLYRLAPSTGADEIRYPDAEEEIWYDLCGRRVDPERILPGIYICNGRKVVIR